MIKIILILSLLFTFGCNKNSPIEICQNQCKGYINTIIRYENPTNIYSCKCDNQ